MIVYLSGSINGHKDDFPRVWREKATEVLEKAGYKTLNPLRHSENCDGDYGYVVDQDLRDLRKSDIILVEMDCHDMPYIGTSMEIFHANQLGLDIIAWGKANRTSYWLQCFICNCYSDHWFDTLDEALVHLVRKKGGYANEKP